MSKPTEVWSFDLDSTVSNTMQRHPLINQEHPHLTDWRAYSMACSKDAVIEPVALTIRALAKSHPIIFVSARDKDAQQITETWLDSHVIPFDHVFLDSVPRPRRLSHAEYKLWRLKGIEEKYNLKVLCHWDDWGDVTNLLNNNGIPSVCVRTPQELAEQAFSKPEEWVI